MENDTFNQTDRHYTNGFKLSWIVHDLSNFSQFSLLPKWSYPLIEWLPSVKAPAFSHDFSISFGQNIYTPDNIQESRLIKGDRPYAGISYLSAGFHNKTSSRMDTLEYYLGIVGPLSYAEDVQKWVHGLVDSDNPEGWDNQLKDEPVLGVTYEGKRKLLRFVFAEYLGYDFYVHYGGGLGNAYTYINTGASFRFGINLPNDFGTCRILPVSCSSRRPSNDQKHGYFKKGGFGIYLFFTVDGQAVLRDIFLDGNTFTDSHSVDKKPFVADFMGGMAVIAGRLRISFAGLTRTKMFETQKENQEYVSLNLSFTY